MAHAWVARLEAGGPKSIAALAKAEKICVLHTAKLLPLAFLAPDLVELILTGRQPAAMTLTSLLAEPLPMIGQASVHASPNSLASKRQPVSPAKSVSGRRGRDT